MAGQSGVEIVIYRHTWPGGAKRPENGLEDKTEMRFGGARLSLPVINDAMNGGI